MTWQSILLSVRLAHRPGRCLPRLLFLVALTSPCLDTAQAATTQFYGVVTGLRFGCTPPPFQGRASLLQVGATTWYLGPNFGAPSPAANETYTLLVNEEAPPGSGRFTISGTWGNTGVVGSRGWTHEEGTTLAGWRDESLLVPPSARQCGGEIYLGGTGSMLEITVPVGEAHCAVGWSFRGQERDKPPKPPRGKWSTDPRRAWLQMQGDLAATCGGGKRVEKAGPPATVAVAPCAAATLCFAPSAKSAPELLVQSRVLPGGRVVVSYLPLGAGATEVWSLPVGEPVTNARSWFVPAAPATGVDRAGFVDLAGYTPPPRLYSEGDELDDVADLEGPATVDEGSWPDEESWSDEVDESSVEHGSTDASIESEAVPSWEEEALRDELQAAAPPPPDGSWLSTPVLPGFRFKGRLDGAALVQSSSCPKQTLCLGTSAAIPAQVFGRVTTRQANGKRWVAAGKFADAAAELWVQQGTAGEVRYYALAARPADSPWLPAVLDRLAFGG